MGERAREAAGHLALLSTEQKNLILEAIASGIAAQQDLILEANSQDVREAEVRGSGSAMIDRLRLTPQRIRDMVDSVRRIAALPDPVGRVLSEMRRPNGLLIRKVSVPLGVIGIIYESRPNVTVDAAVLCLKASNAVILRGSSEALRSNLALVKALTEGGYGAGLTRDSVLLVDTAGRDAVRELVQLEGLVDLAIPRGGESLVRAVTDMARVPVIKHYKGVCHLYVDRSADLNMAVSIAVNAKCQRPGVCNAIEKLLIHKDISQSLLPLIASELQKRGVELRGDTAAREIVSSMKPALDEDWHEEYLDLILAVKVVKDSEEAIDHINSFGSHHSDSIVTEDRKEADRFLQKIDSACVYVNASTRFTDGGEFGMGAEMGISTEKIHARGPMGLEELTTYKYTIIGNGQVRE